MKARLKCTWEQLHSLLERRPDSIIGGIIISESCSESCIAESIDERMAHWLRERGVEITIIKECASCQAEIPADPLNDFCQKCSAGIQEQWDEEARRADRAALRQDALDAWQQSQFDIYVTINQAAQGIKAPEDF